MITGRPILAVLSLALLTGCGASKQDEVQRILDSPIEIESQFEPGTDFSRYHTWNWIPATQIPGQDPRSNDTQLTNAIQEAVDSEMFTRGYQKVDSDFHLIANFFVAIEQVDRAYLEQHYQGNYPQYKVDMTGKQDDNVTWKEGTLVLFLFDASTGQLVWQASAEAEVTQDSTPVQKETRINKAVKMMLASLPKQG